ncbi:MAG: tol-pal system protein YbgF [Gammaproteobacteria bacterium]|nr:tol-pal system protein YbgF [Gammaproteobacteria bacterium]
MRLLVGILTTALTVPAFAVDFFSSASDNRRSPKKPSLEQRVQLLERRINTISNIVLRLDSLQQEMQQLRGDVETQNHAMESMKQRQTDLYTDIDQRMSRLSGKTPAGQSVQPGVVPRSSNKDVVQSGAVKHSGEPSWQSTPITTGRTKLPAATMAQRVARPAGVNVKPKPSRLPPVVSSSAISNKTAGRLNSTSVAVSPPESRPATAPPQASPGEKSSYQKAFNLLMDRKYDLAQNAFRSFLKQHPGSRLADNAQYWLAEANYVTRNFDTSLVEFKKVVQVFPNSPKISDALLKIGYIQYEKKQWSAARKTLGGLVTRYPNSTASQLAKKRLDKILGEGH